MNGNEIPARQAWGEPMTYDDGGVACTEDALVIRRYYFPFGDKRIPYTKIEQVQRRTMARLTGQWRIWGSGDFRHWYNLDSGRPRKTVQFVIHTSGGRMLPVITPDDPDRVQSELTAHGVRVTTA
jgi:hypothetical protein